MLMIPASKVCEHYESEVRSYCRSIPLEFAEGRNALLVTTDGKEYIDFLSGCGALNYGHNDPDMKDALMDYMAGNGIAHSLDMNTRSKNEFVSSFVDHILLPRGMDFKIQFTGPTGTNAVEAALKLARKVTGRPTVVAFTNGFHGMSLGALAATGNKYHRNAAGIVLGGVARFPYDGYLGPQIDTLDLLERMLADPSSGVDVPAAFIVEIVQGEGGCNVATSSWLSRLRRLAERYEALLIIDDIQAGCGRTGTFFSFEGSRIVPDMIILAKSLSGFGLPLAAVLIRRELDIWRPAEHNGTFRGNNHAFVTAKTAIQKFWTDDAFTCKVRERAATIDAALMSLSAKTGWQPKGRGLMRGLCSPSRQIATEVQKMALRNGVVIETCGPDDEVLKLMPPLTIEDDVLAKGLYGFANAVLEIAECRAPA
ncbi:MAG TPA: diaminobutyrate--2-oxoglutarate transaminase [Steroidobacteraceae bacterium]